MSTRFFFTGHTIYEFAALTNITVETEGPSEFSVSGLVFVFEPNSSSSSSFHLTVFSILLLSPLIPDICHFWYATTFDLGRGVRSDVQLSRTETRFQKCSQSGRNGSNPMLSISIAHNVISCKKNWKKHSKKQNRWFYYVNLAPRLRNDKKMPKKMDHIIVLYSIFCIGMVYFRCLLGNPHVQAVQIMWPRGVEGISGRVTGGQSLPFFQKKRVAYLRC